MTTTILIGYTAVVFIFGTLIGYMLATESKQGEKDES